MARPISYNELIAAIKAAADEVSGLGSFDLLPGGASPWSRNGGVPTFHWWAEVIQAKQRITTIPGSERTMSARKEYSVLVEGWYPVVTPKNSQATWDAGIDALLTKLERKRFPARPIPVMFERGQLVENSQQMKASLHQGDTTILCHHCRFFLTYSQEYEFTTVD
jgi:hypothetical protein